MSSKNWIDKTVKPSTKGPERNAAVKPGRKARLAEKLMSYNKGGK
jgi:hypothetical protein